MTTKHALIIDDLEDNRVSLNAALDYFGLTYVNAASGKAGLAYIDSGQRFDFVLLDLMMPEMNGLETLEKINQTCPELPVVVVTAFVEMASNILADGKVKACLPKPIILADLKALLTELFPE